MTDEHAAEETAPWAAAIFGLPIGLGCMSLSGVYGTAR